MQTYPCLLALLPLPLLPQARQLKQKRVLRSPLFAKLPLRLLKHLALFPGLARLPPLLRGQVFVRLFGRSQLCSQRLEGVFVALGGAGLSSRGSALGQGSQLHVPHPLRKV